MWARFKAAKTSACQVGLGIDRVLGRLGRGYRTIGGAASVVVAGPGTKDTAISQNANKWPGLEAAAAVESTRQTDDETEPKTCYHITSVVLLG